MDIPRSESRGGFGPVLQKAHFLLDTVWSKTFELKPVNVSRTRDLDLAD